MKIMLQLRIFGVFMIVLINQFAFLQSQDRIFFQEEQVTSPVFESDYKCGIVPQSGMIFYLHTKGEDGEPERHPIYYYNETAENLASQGFNITVNEVRLTDVLVNFTYSNETYEGRYEYIYYSGVSPIGGEPAPISRSYYMAQLGERRGDDIQWLCDGVLLNNRWILSAAHCFIMPGVNPNIVRLGDYNLTDQRDVHHSAGNKFIRDYPIHKLIPHPEFKIDERYHDLVLIQIPRPIPLFTHNIFPICLPWDSEINRDLVGTEVALTGWGATEYGGPKTPILQEVYLKVFPTSFCNATYFSVLNNRIKYPKGMSKDTVLCVGWDEDGRDACGGDSGAPIVYRKENSYVLAGIVSGGYGCGQKGFPGLYIPINKPRYLQWIKDVAFKDYV